MGLIETVRHTFALPARERFLVLSTAPLILLFWLVLRLVRLERIVAAVNRLATAHTACQLTPERIVELVESVSWRLGKINGCLPRSLVIYLFMRRHGHQAVMRIGVAKDPDFAAHAWIEDLNGRNLSDIEGEQQRFVSIVRI